MATRESRHIDHDLLNEPHITGRRISVRQVAAVVQEDGEDPEVVADRFDLDLAEVYHALAYYHDHPDEMRAVRDDRAEAVEAVRASIDRPDGVDAA
jgi:uncharacterized protein (DUF433 family)